MESAANDRPGLLERVRRGKAHVDQQGEGGGGQEAVRGLFSSAPRRRRRDVAGRKIVAIHRLLDRPVPRAGSKGAPLNAGVGLRGGGGRWKGNQVS